MEVKINDHIKVSISSPATIALDLKGALDPNADQIEHAVYFFMSTVEAEQLIAALQATVEASRIGDSVVELPDD